MRVLGEAHCRIEHTMEHLLEKAREGYLSLVEKFNFIKIDGMRDYNSVREEVFCSINKIITENLRIP